MSKLSPFKLKLFYLAVATLQLSVFDLSRGGESREKKSKKGTLSKFK